MTQEQQVKTNDFEALLWSITMPGLGHLYRGNKIIGFLFIVITFFTMIRTKLNIQIFCVFSGNFKMANKLFADNPTLLFPAVYGFAMWHAYNYDIISRKGNSFREYKLTGFFFGLTIGGVPWSSQKFLGTYIITGVVMGIATGILFLLVEKLILYITRDRS